MSLRLRRTGAGGCGAWEIWGGEMQGRWWPANRHKHTRTHTHTHTHTHMRPKSLMQAWPHGHTAAGHALKPQPSNPETLKSLHLRPRRRALFLTGDMLAWFQASQSLSTFLETTRSTSTLRINQAPDSSYALKLKDESQL